MNNNNVQGTKNNKVKKLRVLMMALTVLTIGAVAIYAYFIAVDKSSAITITTGKIGICFPGFNIEIDKALIPGEPSGVLNEGIRTINNQSSRDLKVELSFEEAMMGYLPFGSKPDDKYVGEDKDYYFDPDARINEKDPNKGYFVMTQKRLREVILLTMKDYYVATDVNGNVVHMPSAFKHQGDGRYTGIIKANNSADIGDIHVMLLKELGGQGDDKRPYEHGTRFRLGIRMAAVPVDYNGHGRNADDVLIDLQNNKKLDYEEIYFRVENELLNPKSIIEN